MNPRWKKILLIAGGSAAGLILLILLIGPAVIASVARSKIASALGERLQADVTVGDVSFGWSGRLEIEGFRIVPRGFAEPLIDVKKIDARFALGAAMGGRYLGDVEISAPRILIEKNAAGRFNYDFPPAPKKPRKPKDGRDKDEEEPSVRLNLRVRDGELRVRDQGRETARANLSAEVGLSDGGVTGTTRITDLELSGGLKTPIKDPAVTIVHDIELGDAAIELRKLDVTSTFLNGQVTGRILSPRELKDLRVTGNYVPDRLGAALAPWLPGKLEGAEARTFDLKLNGRVESFELLALLRGAAGSMDLELGRFTREGLTVSGRTRLELADGKVTSRTPLDVNRGKTALTASLDFNAADRHPRSTLTLGARDVHANASMAPLLENINPIFRTVNGTVDGQIQSDLTLTWSGPIDPDEKEWNKAAARSLSGAGVFSVRNLNIVGSPVVGQIMAALGEPNALKGELLATDLRIADGACEYKNMVLRLARYELRFSGSVKFHAPDKEDELDLLVEMPMSEALVRRYPGLAKYTQKTMLVALKGKRSSPRLDFERSLQEYLKRALEGGIEDKAKDLIEDLLRRRKK